MKNIELLEIKGKCVIPVLKKSVEERLNSLKFVNPKVRELCDYAISDDLFLRAGLVILGCEAVGGHENDVLPAAAAIELLNRSTLVHDDLVDGDSIRYGRETIWSKYGEGNAVFVGDFLCAQAFLMILNDKNYTEDVRTQCSLLLSEMYTRLCMGAIKEELYQVDYIISKDECLELIELLTPPITELGMKMGAIVGGGKDAEVESLANYGKHLGIALFVYNHIEGIFGSKKASKIRGVDILNKKINLLLVYAIENAKNRDREKLLKILKKRRISNADTNFVIKKIIELGSLTYAKNLIISNLKKARKNISLFPKSKIKKDLEHLTISMSNLLNENNTTN